MLRARVITALLLLAGFLAVLFLLPFAGWMLFATAVAAAASWEWGGLVGLRGAARAGNAVATTLLCGLLAVAAFAPAQGERIAPLLLAWIFAPAATFWLAAVPAWLSRRGRAPGGISGALLGGLVVIPACLALMQLRAISPLLLLAVMAAVWVADIAAYFTGRAFGRRKLAPSISPGKTWEGAAGAVVGVLAFGLSAAAAGPLGGAPAATWGMFALLLCGLTAVSIEGDLFESMIKRQAGVKDSGTLLPGHGGLLDRIDSLTSTLPVIGLVVLIWEGRMP